MRVYTMYTSHVPNQSQRRMDNRETRRASNDLTTGSLQAISLAQSLLDHGRELLLLGFP